MTTVFNTREFLYPDDLATYVQLHQGAIQVVSILSNSSGHIILFSNDDEEAIAKINPDLSGFVDQGRGRGLELMSADAMAAACKARIDEAAADVARAKASAAAIKQAEIDARVKLELMAAEDAIRARIASEGK